MSRRAALLALGLWAAPATLAAQATVDFYVPDTALTILTNRIGTAQLRVSNLNGVSAYTITLFMDPGRVQLVGADTLASYQLNPPTITANGEAFTLRGSGPGTTFSTVVLANLKFHLDTLAQVGSLVSIRVDTLVDGLGTNMTAGNRTGLLNVCQAEQIGGDVSGDRLVNSRDALIVLTAAVGLPVTGFDVGRPADVDQDRQVTSRDALFIMSYGIGLAAYGAPLVGAWLTNRCAPLEPAPADMVFWRSGSLYKILSGDTVPTALGLSGVADYYARWSPDGAKLAFTASITNYGYEVMTVNADGTVLDTLTLNTSSDFAPDWSPNGAQIAFVSSRVSPQSIFVMNADGTGQTQLTRGYGVYDLAWSPDGKRLAFTGYDNSVCCARRLWTVNADGSNVAEVFGGSSVHNPQDPVWSPSGDSLIYYSGSRGLVYKVAATGDTVAAASLNAGQDSPWWANTVNTFRSWIRSSYDFFLRRLSDGRQLRLTRGNGGTDLRAALRRTLTAPAIFPDTVTVTPDSIQLLPDGSASLSVVVKNNDGSTVTGPSVSWRSRDTTVANVSGSGVVTASKNLGVTYVVATSGWRSDSTKVVVAATLGAVTTGFNHACALGTDGAAYCWGLNNFGQLGTGTKVSSSHPMRVSGGLTFISITAGYGHTCALTQAGAAYCWGSNAQGQLGIGSLADQTGPTQVTGQTFASVEAGYGFTCGVTTGNAGYCWGDNAYGQLGDSTGVDQTAPSPVKGPASWLSISAGTLHACGVATGGAGYCWGYNVYGRLGDSTTTSRVVPTALYGGRSWSSISAGDQHSCGAETSTGTAYCWGYNGYYQLGNGGFSNALAPTPVSGSLTFTALSAGDLHTCGVTTGNNPYCWGYNGYGQVGDSTSGSYRSTPTAVAGGLLMTGASAGASFSCGITPAGAAPSVVYCWGYNGYGQLGDATVTNRSAPTRVAGQP